MTNDQPPTAETITSGPTWRPVTWHPNAIRRAVDHATTVIADGIPASDQPIDGTVLTWMDIACLLDVARAHEHQGDHVDLLDQAHADVDQLRAQVQQATAERDTTLLRLRDTNRDLANAHDKTAELRQESDNLQSRLNDACATVDRLAAERDEARAQLTALGADQTEHILDVRDGNQAIQHPLTCRPNLLDCPVHHASDRGLYTARPHPGRYHITLGTDGWIDIGDQIHADGHVTNPEPPRCSAHGNAECPSCSLNPANCGDPNSFGDCFSYATDGMHGDTCPNRIRTAPEEVNRG